jgi:competence protein CoiA
MVPLLRANGADSIHGPVHDRVARWWFVLLARDVTGARIRATRGAHACCPSCEAALIPKCGELVSHHWAHQAERGECDPWAEHETDWHLSWKSRFPEDWIEVIVGPHRADVRRPDGVVFEIQHSTISVEEIREREAFYEAHGWLEWIFDVREAAVEGRFELRKHYRDMAFSFVWRHGRRSIGACACPVWLDLGLGRLFAVMRMRTDGDVYKLAGWGHLRWLDAFLYRATTLDALAVAEAPLGFPVER